MVNEAIKLPGLEECLQEIEKFISAVPKPGDEGWETQKKIATNAVAHIKRLGNMEFTESDLVKCPTRQEYLH